MKIVLLAVLLTLPMGVEARERYRLAPDKSSSGSTKAEGEKAKKDSEVAKKKASEEKKTQAGVRRVTLKDALSRAEEIQKARDQRTGEKTRHTEVTYEEFTDFSKWPKPYQKPMGCSHPQHQFRYCSEGEKEEFSYTYTEVNSRSALRHTVTHRHLKCVPIQSEPETKSNSK